MKAQIALGMYTVHNAVARDMKGVFLKLAEMGYQGIEFYGEPSDFPAAAVREALAASGLILTSWHIEWRNLQKDLIERSIEYFHEVGLTRAIIPCLGGVWNVAHSQAQECEKVWRDYLGPIEGIRERLARENVLLGYHNHEHELKLTYGCERVFDILYKNFDPRIIMELDTGNAIEGGADPVDLMGTYKGRQILLHLKPYSRTASFNVTLGDPGDENDYPAIIRAAGDRCEWLIIESEDNRPEELENARASIDALKAKLTL